MINGSSNIGGIVGNIENSNVNNYNINNCKIEQCTLFSTNGSCGGIFGKISYCTNISNCISKDSTITTKAGYAGGIIGTASRTNITKCANYSTIIRE